MVGELVPMYRAAGNGEGDKRKAGMKRCERGDGGEGGDHVERGSSGREITATPILLQPARRLPISLRGAPVLS